MGLRDSSPPPRRSVSEWLEPRTLCTEVGSGVDHFFGGKVDLLIHVMFTDTYYLSFP